MLALFVCSCGSVVVECLGREQALEAHPKATLSFVAELVFDQLLHFVVSYYSAYLC